MDQAPRRIAEQHVDLLRFQHRCYLTVAELEMVHSLAFAVFACAVVGRSFLRPAVSYRGLHTAIERTDGLARIALRF